MEILENKGPSVLCCIKYDIAVQYPVEGQIYWAVLKYKRAAIQTSFFLINQKRPIQIKTVKITEETIYP